MLGYFACCFVDCRLKSAIDFSNKIVHQNMQNCPRTSGLEVIKLEFFLRLKIKRNDWLLADMCPQVANHCALF